jgi:hypothetical protein
VIGLAGILIQYEGAEGRAQMLARLRQQIDAMSAKEIKSLLAARTEAIKE